MAEFLIHRDPIIENTTLVLRVANPTYGSERPLNDPCAHCPVRASKIPGGCLTLQYVDKLREVRAEMPTEVEEECGIITNPNHRVKIGNVVYNSSLANYGQTETREVLDTLAQDVVRRVVNGDKKIWERIQQKKEASDAGNAMRKALAEYDESEK